MSTRDDKSISHRRLNQLASTFYVAAELTRRGYIIITPSHDKLINDLQVTSPSGCQFDIIIKGQYSKNFWHIRKNIPRNDLFYILVYVPLIPKEADSPRYFIITSHELMKRRDEYKEYIENKSLSYNDKLGGIKWSTSFEYENKWEILPG